MNNVFYARPLVVFNRVSEDKNYGDVECGKLVRFCIDDTLIMIASLNNSNEQFTFLYEKTERGGRCILNSHNNVVNFVDRTISDTMQCYEVELVGYFREIA